MAKKEKAAGEHNELGERDPLVITLAELENRTEDEREAFRQSGGTVTNNPETAEN